MIRQLRDLGDRFFPELQILFRRGGRVTYLSLTSSRQLTGIAGLVLVLLGLGYLGFRVQYFGTTVLSRNHAIANADREKTALAQELAAMRDALAEAESRAEAVGEQNDRLNARLTSTQKQLATLESAHKQALAELQQRLGELDAQQTRALAEAQRRIAELDDERTRLVSDRSGVQQKLAHAQDSLNAKSSNIASLTKELEKDRDLLRHSDSNQVALETRIQVLEKELAQANLSTEQYRAQLASIEQKLTSLTKERDRLVARREKAQRAQQQNRLAGQEIDNRATVAALNKIGKAEAGQKGSPDMLATLPDGTGHRIEKLLASTGLDLTKLLKDISASEPKAEGGPFVPLGDAMTASEESRRHRLLEKLIETLPLRAPLDHYWVSSPFGARVDPFNHRHAFHEGVDLAAPYRSHVYSTAPGTVIFAGTDAGFGRLVKIDNGHGIVTFFAHLHRIYVVRGQHVSAHYPIGEMGCTGRCDGPHVHYQIEVDGTPVNPAKFLGAGGNVVQVGARQ